MALCFRGKTECSICGVILTDDDDVVLHPHVLSSDHPLGRFSDSSMHRACYEHWEYRGYFEAVLNKAREIQQNRPTRLLRNWKEVKQLPPIERKRLSDEIDSWYKRASDELDDFVTKLGVRSLCKNVGGRKTAPPEPCNNAG
jgi:hypothetical protein